MATEAARLERDLADHHRDLARSVGGAGDRRDAGLAASLLAAIQERIAAVELRRSAVRQELADLAARTINEAEVTAALARFDPVWETLDPSEQARALELLIERIDYDGREGAIAITFHASGLKSLANRDSQGDAA